MNALSRIAKPVVGLNIPAEIGASLDDVHTPALIVDLDAFERNVKRMRDFATKMGVRHRAHAKTHKSADIARIQIDLGGAVGVCCQKVSEAEAIVDGGIRDVLVSNQVVDPKKIDRLAQLAGRARVLVCVDDIGNVDDLSEAAVKHDTTIEFLDAVQKHALPLRTGLWSYMVGRDEALVEQNLRICAQAGSECHNLMVYKKHADGHPASDEEICNFYLLASELGDRFGITIGFEVHIYM